jgi:selenium-binding protein 1
MSFKFELRPAHEPDKTYGLAGVVLSLKDLSSSIWTWYRENGRWAARKTIDIPAQAADPADLPDPLKGFKAVPPLVTDIDLDLDDRFLYVSCWGTGEMHQYDVTDPFKPKLTGKVEIGGIVRRKGHPKRNSALLGGPQMVEISRDAKRVYFTNSLYSVVDDQFYPDRMGGWMVKLNVGDGAASPSTRMSLSILEKPAAIK